VEGRHSRGGASLQVLDELEAAGLLDHLLWPGEFRLLLEWHRGRGKEKKVSVVSLFQCTSEADVAAWCALQKQPLEKYLSHGGPDSYGTLAEHANDPTRILKTDPEPWCYYFDAEDAQKWGRWYGNIMVPWTQRFLAFPESKQDWCRRVLWPDLPRPEKNEG
jgi:hypothetical protein